MSDYATILYELDDSNVANITLNRPERRNAVSFEMVSELAAALDRAAEEGARALLLTGAGSAFCSGGDLVNNKLNADVAKLWLPVLARLRDAPFPTVCAVQGAAIGAGCTIALSLDFTLMARSAYFRLTFVDVGMLPGVGTSWLLNRLVGRQRAMQMMVGAEKISAEQASDWGLAYKLSDDADLLADARTLASRLAAGPTVAFRELKRVLKRIDEGCTYPEFLDAETEAHRNVFKSTDAVEGVEAFRAKRAPRFQGR